MVQRGPLKEVDGRFRTIDVDTKINSIVDLEQVELISELPMTSETNVSSPPEVSALATL